MIEKMQGNTPPELTPLQRIVLHPLAGGFLTLLIIFTGGWGSLYGTEIKGAFPFGLAFKEPLTISVPALGFWILALASGLLFFLQQKAGDRRVEIRQMRDQAAREQAQNELVERAEEQKRLINTLPPENVMAYFATLADDAASTMKIIFGPPPQTGDQAALVAGGRQLLRIIAILAQIFDGGDPTTSYGANVMQVRKLEHLSPEEMKRLQRQLFFCEENVSVELVGRVLELRPELSATASDNDAGPDKSLTPFVLPIPLGDQKNSRKILPGAPWAFFSHSSEIFPDKESIRLWCDANCDFSPSLKTKIAEYFRQQEFESFISIPLFAVTGGEDNDDSPINGDNKKSPIGILNIHSSRKEVVSFGGQASPNFITMVRPFQLDLVQILSFLWSV